MAPREQAKKMPAAQETSCQERRSISFQTPSHAPVNPGPHSGDDGRASYDTSGPSSAASERRRSVKFRAVRGVPRGPKLRTRLGVAWCVLRHLQYWSLSFHPGHHVGDPDTLTLLCTKCGSHHRRRYVHAEQRKP